MSSRPDSSEHVAQLIEAVGRRPDGSPDVQGIARALKRSERSVYRYLRAERLPTAVMPRVIAVTKKMTLVDAQWSVEPWPAMRLADVGGRRRDGSPDVRKIAQWLGVSERSVYRYLKAERLPERIERWVSAALGEDRPGVPAWIEPDDTGVASFAILANYYMPPPAHLSGSLLQAFPGSDGNVDTRRAAEVLGVSRRTVQRWLSGDSRPTQTNQRRLRRATREAGVRTRRAARIRNSGSRVLFTADFVKSNDARVREFGRRQDIWLTGPQMEAIQKGYVIGGEAGAMTVFKEAIAQTPYMRSFDVGAEEIRSVKELEFRAGPRATSPSEWD